MSELATDADALDEGVGVVHTKNRESRDIRGTQPSSSDLRCRHVLVAAIVDNKHLYVFDGSSIIIHPDYLWPLCQAQGPTTIWSVGLEVRIPTPSEFPRCSPLRLSWRLAGRKAEHVAVVCPFHTVSGNQVEAVILQTSVHAEQDFS